MDKEIDKNLLKRASRVMPGGVNSPVRAFKGTGTSPVFAGRGDGSHIFDTEEKKYIDFLNSWGALILGHAHPEIIEEVTAISKKGTTFGLTVENEIKLAEKIVEIYPSVDKIRMTSSGTEAVMSAVRTARGYTGKDKIIKFEGCYHGHADYLLAGAGSGAGLIEGLNSEGVPENFTRDTLVVPYNDIEKFKETVEEFSDKIAAVLIEPVAGNMGVIKPEEGYLENLRKICTANDMLLIFDEVITGFRLSLSGAQGYYGVTPDLTCLGKIAGGGFPAAVFGGRKDIMDRISPEGNVYHAGTLSGNPVAVAAGLKVIEILERENPYPELKKRTEELVAEFKDIFKKSVTEVTINHSGSMFSIHFTGDKINNLETVKRQDTELFKNFYSGALKEGILFAPSPMESNFLSIAHSRKDIEKTVEKVRKIVKDGGLDNV